MGAIQEKIISNTSSGQDGATAILPPRFVLFLIIIHLLVAVPLAYVLGIWVDEASTLYTTSSISHALANALKDEIQAPLYFWLLSVWRAVDSSIFFARLFSVWCSALSIKVAWDVAVRFLPAYARKFAVVIFALHPLLFWASTEIRGYALVILLSLLLLRFFYDGYLSDRRSLKSQIIYIFVATVSLYTNYFLGFLLVGNFCALLTVRKFKPATHYLGHMFVVALLFSPLGYALNQQFDERNQIGERSLLEGVRTLWQHLQTFLLPVNVFIEEASVPALLRLWIFRAGAAVVVVCLWFAKRKNISEGTIALGAISFVSILFFIAVVTLLGSGYTNIRHTALLLPTVVMFFAALLYEVFSKKGLAVWAALLVFFIPFSTWQMFDGLTKRGDWERVAAYISSHETPGQAVLIFKPYDSVAFRIYYHGANTILPREGFFDWSQQNHFNFTERLPEQTTSLVSQILAETTEVWVLTGEVCDDPKAPDACRALEEYFGSNYTMVDDRRFYLERVRLYRKK